MKERSRLHRLYPALQERGLDGLIISSPHNISYLSGFTSRDSYFLASPKTNLYFTDSRYSAEVKGSLKDKAVLKEINGSVFRLIADSCRQLRLKRIGFEERLMPFAEYKNIKRWSGKGLVLVPVHSMVEELRKYKSKEELGHIRKAVSIAAKALNHIGSLLRPGLTELEVASEVECHIRRNGALKASFDIIVASGPNSSFPHHITSTRKLQKNETVLIDMGVDCQGYKSDLTRVFFLGKINLLRRKIYGIVLEAQKRALEKIRPGIRASEIDAAARQHIARSGYGAYFLHSLGHGVGLEIHEEPQISAKSDNIVAESMVFTVEPAIYLPGKFGIRIEDMVLVTEKGCEVLSGAVDK